MNFDNLCLRRTVVSESCEGCKFLFKDGHGYSDWTWLGTTYECALGENSRLGFEEYYDKKDNIKALERAGGRCDRYSPGTMVTVSPDGQHDEFHDAEQEAAIREARYVSD